MLSQANSVSVTSVIFMVDSVARLRTKEQPCYRGRAITSGDPVCDRLAQSSTVSSSGAPSNLAFLSCTVRRRKAPQQHDGATSDRLPVVALVRCDQDGTRRLECDGVIKGIEDVLPKRSGQLTCG